MKIYTVLQSFDTPNRNKRYYPLNIMKEAIQNFIDLVNNNEAYGELGHPEDINISRAFTIHPRFVSHIVREVYLEDNLLKGVVEPTGPYGDALKDLAQKGKIGFSARVYASNWIKNEQGLEEPRGKIHIICYDAVIIPSHKEAYIESIKIENSNIVTENLDICSYDTKICGCDLSIPKRKLIKL